MKKILCLLLLFVGFSMQAQDFVPESFNDRRVINSHSTEMLERGKMDFRTSHRFGDMFGTSGGWQSFYGLENAADIGIGIDFGLNDNINIGIHRNKGAGEIRQLVYTFAKVRLMRQRMDNRNPFSLSVLWATNISTMQSSTDANSIANFGSFSNRLAYHGQVLMSRRFSSRFSLQTSLNYTYRDQVYSFDQNDILSIGFAARLRLTKAMAIIVDGTIPVLVSGRETALPYQYPIGAGVEFTTGGGHVFQINLTNARGLTEPDYIPNTFSDWRKGEFRLGFTIGRKFTVF